jgi:hypothetical protein
MICDVKMMTDQMIQIGYDAKKMPLGGLAWGAVVFFFLFFTGYSIYFRV